MQTCGNEATISDEKESFIHSRKHVDKQVNLAPLGGSMGCKLRRVSFNEGTAGVKTKKKGVEGQA